ncbi:MAG: hypothetical protein RL065_1799 [Bacteroidota bacterium]|jgi:glycosyltransferase involved in cell wall biosynthesis
MNKKLGNVWVVMPIYNEEEALPKVIAEWLPILRDTLVDFVFCIINDGSKDNSLQILNEIASQNPEIKVIDKPNTGHGQSCLFGYKFAIEKKADWVFQIDSDGQCDPKHFPDFVKEANENLIIYGFRKTREDGFSRFIISRVVSLYAFLATGIWVKDANVPYRLMNKKSLMNFIEQVPSDFHLANILVSVYHKKFYKIKWININFRDRSGGTPSVKVSAFSKHGRKLFKQLSDFHFNPNGYI